jgi:hypothetical protein
VLPIRVQKVLYYGGDMAFHLRWLHYVREPGIPGGGMPEENAPSASSLGVFYVERKQKGTPDR